MLIIITIINIDTLYSLDIAGMLGLYFLTGHLMSAMGSNLLMMSMGNQHAMEERRFVHLIRPLAVIVSLLVMFLIVLIFVWSMGERDADRRLQNAPKAKVEMKSISINHTGFSHESDQYINQRNTYVYKVISIDEKFAYLLQSDAENWDKIPPIRILPISDIKSISYISDQSNSNNDS